MQGEKITIQAVGRAPCQQRLLVLWLVMRMEDGLDWQDAHMGSREIIMGGGEGRGLITETGTVLSAWFAFQTLPVQLSLGFPSMFT